MHSSPQEAPLETHAINFPPISFININLTRSITCWLSPKLEDPPFIFDCSDSSLKFKNKVMEPFVHDVKKIIKSSSNEILKPGSKFRDLWMLDPLLQHCPSWKKVKNMILDGANCDFTLLIEEEMNVDLKLEIERGNHDFASSNPDRLVELVQADIVHGFQLLLPLDSAPHIVKEILVPCSIAH